MLHSPWSTRFNLTATNKMKLGYDKEPISTSKMIGNAEVVLCCTSFTLYCGLARGQSKYDDGCSTISKLILLETRSSSEDICRCLKKWQKIEK